MLRSEVGAPTGAAEGAQPYDCVWPRKKTPWPTWRFFCIPQPGAPLCHTCGRWRYENVCRWSGRDRLRTRGIGKTLHLFVPDLCPYLLSGDFFLGLLDLRAVVALCGSLRLRRCICGWVLSWLLQKPLPWMADSSAPLSHLQYQLRSTGVEVDRRHTRRHLR